MRVIVCPSRRRGHVGLRGLTISSGARPSSTGRNRRAVQAMVSPSGTASGAEDHAPRPLLEAKRDEQVAERGPERRRPVDLLERQPLDLTRFHALYECNQSRLETGVGGIDERLKPLPAALQEEHGLTPGENDVGTGHARRLSALRPVQRGPEWLG